MKGRIYHSLPSFSHTELQACSRVLKSNYIASGPENKKLISSLCKRYKRKYAVLVSSGANALFLALTILKNKNKNVILPSYVCSALLNSVFQAGLKPIVVDTPLDGIFMANTDKKLNQFSIPKNSIIIYPQMFGIVKKINYNKTVPIIEDCAMSLGNSSLAQGDISIMSMYATKMITSGQGGALLTDKEEIFNEINDLLNYDNRDTFRPRYNMALSDLSAAIANAQLNKLDSFIKKRKILCSLYDDLISKKCPQILAHKKGLAIKYIKEAPFRYWVKVTNIDECIAFMEKHNIEVKRPVYKPLHRYLNLKDENYPHATAAYESILSLPLYPGLNKTQVNKVVTTLCQIAKP